MYLCLAGGLSKRTILKEAGARSIRVSFAELKRFSSETRRRRMEELRRDFDFVFVDSGAHSFFVEEGMVAFRERKESLGSPEEWFGDYLQFVLENHEMADGLAELDIDAIVGLDWVLKRRRQAMDAGWPVEKYVPVFHSKMASNPLAVFGGWCEEYPYVATEGSIQKGFMSYGVGGQRKILDAARKQGARLHAFAMTGVEMLRRVPYYSVDSTSWLSGSMYGITFSLKGYRMAQIQQKDRNRRKILRKRVLFQLEKRGLDIPASVQQGYLDDKGHDVDWVHAAQWAAWEKALTEMWQSRGLHCTCLEDRGSCKFHGLGLSGNPPPVIVEHDQETKDKIALAQEGNLNALVHGRHSPRLPQLQCNDCYLAERCKGYEEEGACKFDKDFAGLAKSLGTRTWETLVEFLTNKMGLDSARYMRGLLFEAADGGIADKAVTGLSSMLSSDLGLLAKLLGYLTDAPHVDARQIQILIQNMPDEGYEKLLQAVCDIRDVAPALLEGPLE